MNWKSKKHVVALIAAVCLLMAIGGAAAAWHNRHKTICGNHEVPTQQMNGILGQTEYRCPDGRVVTTS